MISVVLDSRCKRLQFEYYKILSEPLYEMLFNLEVQSSYLGQRQVQPFLVQLAKLGANPSYSSYMLNDKSKLSSHFGHKSLKIKLIVYSFNL